MKLTGNGYQRIQIEFTELPRMQIQRNLSRMVIEYQRTGEPDFRILDTIPFFRFFFSDYVTQPRLEQNVSYSARVAAFYRNGVVQRGNAVSFVSPVVRGKILQRIPLPQPRPGTTYYGRPDDYCFRQGQLYVMEGENLVTIDPHTGSEVIVKDDLWTPRRLYFSRMGIHRDTLLLLEHDFNYHSVVRLYWYNIQNFQLLRSAELGLPGEGNPGDICYNGRLIYLLWWYYSGRPQIFELDGVTGAVHRPTERKPISFRGLVLSNDELWAAFSVHFDNRIQRIDPLSTEVYEEHQNPVFNAWDVAWDGTNFWVYDYETQTFAKLELEGM